MLKRTTVSFALIIAMALALISPQMGVNAQGLLRAAAPEDVGVQPIIRSSVNLVTIYATVNDKTGRFVGGLKPEDFEVFDNEVSQKIEYFSEEDHPISIGILFDTSGSMKDRIEDSSKILRHFLESRNKEDEFFLLTFNTTITMGQDFTSSTDEIINSLLDVSPSGLTALNDAVYAGIEKVKQAHNGKHALLLISDGEDNNSWYSKQELSNMLSEADVQLYAINICQEPRSKMEDVLERDGRETLKRFAQISGGLAFFPHNVGELDTSITAISTELRHQYSLGFTPSMGLDGRWHKLKVRVKKVRDDQRSQLAVRSRAGYQARVQ